MRLKSTSDTRVGENTIINYYSTLNLLLSDYGFSPEVEKENYPLGTSDSTHEQAFNNCTSPI